MQNNKIRMLNACNKIAMAFYIAAIPGYYIFDYRIMNGIFTSCAVFLFLCLLQFLYYGRFRLLITALAIFIAHILSKA